MSQRQRTASPTRRRATRACDQCRRTKSRCDNLGQSNKPCHNCSVAAVECTFLQPCHKRGPPKGYLNAIEQRLHDAEALLGAIILSKDSRASTLLVDICKDPLAKSIVNTVANSSFGPIGRNAMSHMESKPNARRHSNELREQSTNEHEALYLDNNGHLVFTTPSNTWQDYLNLRISIEVRTRLSKHSSAGTASAQPSTINQDSIINSPSSIKSPEMRYASVLSNYAFPSPPVLDSELIDPDGTAMSVDSYDSPVSVRNASMRRGSSSGSEDEEVSTLSVRSNPSMSFRGPGRDNDKTQSFQVTNSNLMESLGLECGSPSLLGSSSYTTRSPLDAHRFSAIDTTNSDGGR